MFRFTIRDMLWLTVVVAVCCGWWMNNKRMRRVVMENKINADISSSEAERLKIRLAELRRELDQR